jgi:hypothetical protein
MSVYSFLKSYRGEHATSIFSEMNHPVESVSLKGLVKTEASTKVPT